MAKKVIKEQDNMFVDEVSGISYKWLKEEVEEVNSISCWSAKDQWGNKDYFVVKEGKILKGPYRTVKETCDALNEGLEDDVQEVEEPAEERVNAGIVDQLRQASTQVTELIRKCEELIQWTDDEGKGDLVAVLKDIVGVESENIGKIQTMIGTLSDTTEAIDDGEEKAEEIMQAAEDDDVVFGIEDDEEVFDEAPALPLGYQMPPLQVQPPMPMNNDNPNDTSNIIVKRYALDADEFDDDLIGF